MDEDLDLPTGDLGGGIQVDFKLELMVGAGMG
jgi:hypothetical protein